MLESNNLGTVSPLLLETKKRLGTPGENRLIQDVVVAAQLSNQCQIGIELVLRYCRCTRQFSKPRRDCSQAVLLADAAPSTISAEGAAAFFARLTEPPGFPKLDGVNQSRSRWSRFLEESRFVRHYLWKYRRLIAIGLASLLAIDILETVPPLILKSVVDSLAGTDRSMLLPLAAAYLGIALLQAAGRYCWRMYLIRTSMFAGRDLRNRFALHLFGSPASFFDKHRIGDLMSHATNDVEAVRMMIGAGILTLADALFYFMVVPVVMYRLSPELTLLAFIPLPVIPWLVMRNERAIHVRYARVQECLGRLSAMAQESFSGIRVVKAFARENTQFRRFHTLGGEYRALSLSLARVQSAFGPLLDFTMSLGMASLLYFGGARLIESGDLSLGVFVAFQRYIQQMVWPMAAVGMSLSFYRRAATSTERLQNIFDIPSDVPEPAAPRLPARGPGESRAGRVEFRNLSFSFPGSGASILRGIDLDIAPGERVAFIGTSGSGKSALLSLVPRLYPVERGMLFVDGIDINDWPLAELRRRIGYVGQDVFLFSESVAENIALGMHEWVEDAGSIPAIHHAAEAAAIHDEVQGLSAAYDTRLGERGVNISGGQKQRLTLARALIRQPSVLVLDDALSSVDTATEERILCMFRGKRGRHTELVAAHRISTIQDADRIVVLENGTIVQTGTHRELAAGRDGPYWKFYEQQRLREDLERYIETDGSPFAT